MSTNIGIADVEPSKVEESSTSPQKARELAIDLSKVAFELTGNAGKRVVIEGVELVYDFVEMEKAAWNSFKYLF